jgi:hypothetical protein
LGKDVLPDWKLQLMQKNIEKMTPNEEQQIKHFNREIADTKIQITVKMSNHSQSSDIQKFGEILSHLVPSLIIKNERTDDDSELPAIVIGNSLYYHAVPMGRELDPFLTALKMSVNAGEHKLTDLKQNLSELTSAASFDIFIALHCPFCPVTVRAMIPLSFMSNLIRISVIDAGLFPDLALARGVRSVPMVFLDQSFSWTGEVDINEIIRVVENRDPTLLSTESLKKMLHEGFAWKVAEMMATKGLVFPNFIELLVNSKWTVRLGAMAAVEEMIFRNPALGAQLEKFLWQKLPDLEDPVKGDMLYILGETGNRKTVSTIESILKESVSKDIQEAAQEAINTIIQRIS